MGKTVENPKRYIVSCRVNDDEMEALQRIAANADLSISNLLRRSLDDLLDERLSVSAA